jgi:aurora kinase
MIPSCTQLTRNDVHNRFLPIPGTVLKGLESEPKISDFTILKELGAGSYGRVILVQHKITQAKYAIKCIDKRNKVNIEEKPYFRREIEIMYRVHHPNVVKLFGHFEDNKYCYFIMEYIPGGNVYNLVPKNGFRTVPIQTIASIMKDVISAVYFLHHMSPPIIHRDIKPENVVLDQNMKAKLTDFGWSNYMQGDMKRTTVCGTPVYLAPEIINNRGHDEKVDIWCIGVLLFELLTGISPFQGFDVQSIKYNINRLNIAWQKNMDRDAVDLIKRILKYNPEERISLENMLLHPFMTKFFPNAISCLIKPDNTQYKLFIISKDNPLTWNPIFTGNDYAGIKLRPYYNQNINALSQYNYNNLLKKYDSLKQEYTDLQKVGFSKASLENLRKELVEKEKKINQLRALGFGSGKTNMNVTYNDLKNENYDLRNILNQYKTQYNTTNQNVIYLNNNFNEIMTNISNNNKNGFNQAFNKLKTNIVTYTQNNYNAIISMKDQEIKKWKEEERLRREREKQQYNMLINKYDQNLSNRERENQQLKMRLKELEGYFA